MLELEKIRELYVSQTLYPYGILEKNLKRVEKEKAGLSPIQIVGGNILCCFATSIITILIALVISKFNGWTIILIICFSVFCFGYSIISYMITKELYNPNMKTLPSAVCLTDINLYFETCVEMNNKIYIDKPNKKELFHPITYDDYIFIKWEEKNYRINARFRGNEIISINDIVELENQQVTNSEIPENNVNLTDSETLINF